ncbi:MAG: hypothetical protein ABJP65_07570 [Sneathiella sp.]
MLKFAKLLVWIVVLASLIGGFTLSPSQAGKWERVIKEYAQSGNDLSGVNTSRLPNPISDDVMSVRKQQDDAAEQVRQAEARRLEEQRRIEAEQAEARRLEEQRRIEAEQAEARRLEEQRRIEAEQAEARRLEEQKRVEQQQAEARRLEEQKRVEQQQAEARRLEEQKRVEQQQAEARRLEEQKRVEQQQAEARRLEEQQTNKKLENSTTANQNFRQGGTAKKYVGKEAAESKSDSVIHVTKSGVALPLGTKHQIPNHYVQNPHRSGSYGEVINGKFREKLRIDPLTPSGKKGPNYSHYHKNGKNPHYSPRLGDKDPGFHYEN